MFYSDPPSKEVFSTWLAHRGIKHSSACKLDDLNNGQGWSIYATEDVEQGVVLYTAPKTAIFSHRTASLSATIPLPPIEEVDPSDITLHLALCLLHEFRLGTQSEWYGYLQMLPRETILLPAFWEDTSISGEEGTSALEWLQGTEAERELARKEQEGLGTNSVKEFYTSAAPLLPGTPPSFPEFIYALSLILTRGYGIDAYRGIAIVPFCDMFNHSTSNPHTSLLTDGCVCTECGSLQECQHPSNRLDGLDGRYISSSENVVEMRAEREIKCGEQVFSCYEEAVGDGKLLVEWGFIEGKEAEITWTPREVLSGGALRDFVGIRDQMGNISNPRLGPSGSFNLKQQLISVDMFAAAVLSTYTNMTQEKAFETVVRAIQEVESKLESTTSELSPSTCSAIERIIQHMEVRRSRYHQSDVQSDELFHNVSWTESKRADRKEKSDRPLVQMAFSLAVSERRLLERTLGDWQQLLD